MHRNRSIPLFVVGCAALAGFLLTSCGISHAEEDGNPTAGQRSALSDSASCPPPYLRPVSCSIDLVNNTHTCASISAISIAFGPLVHQAVAKIDFRCYSAALIRTYYTSAPTGWVVNIGDSVSNNGWGGDAANQSNDAELQILDRGFSAYASDYGQAALVANQAGAASAGSYNDFLIADHWLDWSVGPSWYHVTDSSNLFALRGEPDSEGPINYDIYAAFNRVIYGTRSGSGCGYVNIHLQ